MAAVVNRKSLMLENTEYEAITAIAKKAKVPRPLVLQALLAVAEEGVVLAKIDELRVVHKEQAEEERRKRLRLAELASGLDLEAIERLIAQVEANGASDPGAESGRTGADAEKETTWIERA